MGSPKGNKNSKIRLYEKIQAILEQFTPEIDKFQSKATYAINNFYKIKRFNTRNKIIIDN